MSDYIGKQLGNYRLTRLLGQGGFAEVYACEHVYLKTQAAIKILQTKVADQGDLDSFLKEAQTIARLVHPHIVRVLDFGVDGKTPFLVMDYAPGGTLRQLHPKGTRLPLTTIIPYVKQVADALQHAHDEKIIHRDVKPENMLVGCRNRILLGDFGIALITQSSRYQSTQEVIGTIAYMAPEQIQARARPASDQYALGIVVYEWLCGERPFEGSYTEIFAKHLMTPPLPLCQKVPTLAQEVERVVLKALAKEPGERFGTVQDFALALEQASQLKQSVLVSPQKEGDSPAVPPFLPPVAMLPTQLDAQTEPHPPRIVPPTLGQSSSPNLVQGGAFHRYPIKPASVHSFPPRWLGRKKIILRLSITSLVVVAVSVLLGRLVSQYCYLLIYVGVVLSCVSWAGALDHASKMRGWGWGGCLAILIFFPALWGIGALIYAALCSADPPCTYHKHSDRVESVAWSPDGSRIASASSDHTVHVWDTTDGSSAAIYRGHSGPVESVTWSPDGKRIASASSDGTVQIWNAADGGNTYFYRRHFSRVESVAWSPDSRRIASASSDYTVHVWDVADGNAYIYRGHSGEVYSVAWSPDGKAIASGSADKTVQVWNATDGSNVFIYKGHSEPVHSVAWEPSGKRVVSGSSSSNYGTMQVWDASDGSNVRKHKGPSGKVWSVAWSPDGKRIASGSGSDGIVQVWNAMEVAGF